MQGAVDMLKKLEVPFTVRVISAHRTPEAARDFAAGAADAGYGVIICGAGKAAHLAGAFAANTCLPIEGVPIKSSTLDGLDALLAKHGYTRDGVCYRTEGLSGASDAFMKYDDTTELCLQDADPDEPVLVIFCHLAVMMMMCAHLLNISPHTLLHGIFFPPASVTVLSAEERIPGQAYFRAQAIGDTSHFRFAGEPVSYYGGFTAPFQQ
jgi:hypothetical protein